MRGNSCGHDFDFHLLSWMEVARAWNTGLLYPHWVQDANYGAGEPRLIFYPPASWLLGGLLGTISGWHAAPVLFVLLALLGAGGSMYLLAREWASTGAATFAACLYIANPYAMFVVYERSALGELLAGAWLPVDGAICAQNPFFHCSPRPVDGGALANQFTGRGGGQLYARTSGSGNVDRGRQAMAGSARQWVEWLSGWDWPRSISCPRHSNSDGYKSVARSIPGCGSRTASSSRTPADAFHDQVLRTASWIFIAELAVASIAAYLAWRKRAGGRARIALTASLPVILLLQLPVSDVIWKHTPHMKFLQFPWRWLLALSVVACVLAGMALKKPGRRPARWAPIIATVVIAAMAIGGGFLFFQPCDDEDAVAAQVAGFRLGQGTQGTDEYTPVGADNASIQQHLPLVRVLRAAQDDTADSTQGDNPEWQAGPLAASRPR